MKHLFRKLFKGPPAPLRGVNLGGWLVLEPWITPSLFKNTAAPDEFSYCQQADPQQRKRLEAFRRRFITLQDFKWLQAQGIGAVRIPVGYWLFGDEPPYQPTVAYLDKAFAWAAQTNVQVLISLHAAPGSQNGEMHSGRQGKVAWHTDPANVERMLELVEAVAKRYKGSPQLLGIELLNEPSSAVPKRVLKRYYRQAYRCIRQVCGRDTWVVFSDGFKPRRWKWVLHNLFYHKAIIDSHQYQIFTEAHKAMDVPRHLHYTQTKVARLLRRMRRHHYVIVGEWSVALDPHSLARLTPAQVREAYRQYYQAQLAVYGRTDGWFYWTYKTEDKGPWSFRDLDVS